MAAGSLAYLPIAQVRIVAIERANKGTLAEDTACFQRDNNAAAAARVNYLVSGFILSPPVLARDHCMCAFQYDKLDDAI